MKRWLGSLILLVLTAFISVVAQAAQDPLQMVQTTADQVLERLKKDHDRLQKSPDMIYPLVEDLVLPYFDFSKMSQLAMGTEWRNATTQQRFRFMVEFRNLLIRTYAKALLEYTNQKITYLPFNAEAGAKTVVIKTEIVQPGGQNVSVHYSLYLKGEDWKVYDITVDGVSLVNNYRNSFAEDLRQGGLEKLIARLVEMNSADKGAQ